MLIRVTRNVECHKNLIWVKVFKNEQIKFVEDNL